MDKIREDLKRCPFCGSQPTQSTNGGSYGYIPPSVRIGCATKECPIQPSVSAETEKWTPRKGTYSIYAKALKSVEDAWNTRKSGGEGVE